MRSRPSKLIRMLLNRRVGVADALRAATSRPSSGSAHLAGMLEALAKVFPTPVMPVGDLMQRTEEEIVSVKNFGRKSLDEVREKLTVLGLSLKRRE